MATIVALWRSYGRAQATAGVGAVGHPIRSGTDFAAAACDMGFGVTMSRLRAEGPLGWSCLPTGGLGGIPTLCVHQHNRSPLHVLCASHGLV